MSILQTIVTNTKANLIEKKAQLPLEQIKLSRGSEPSKRKI